MGAAIPHLMQLACALPGILPYPRNEIFMDVETGTVEVQDELLPDSLDEDVVYNTRCKSTLKVTFTIGKGEGASKKRYAGKGSKASVNVVAEMRVLEEPEQEEERPGML
jgi:ribonuclease P/MRP protein subunit RPP20